MKELSKAEQLVLDAVKENPGMSTHKVRRMLGYSEGMETTVRLRLTVLEQRGLVVSREEETTYKTPARRWYPVDV